MCGRYYIAGEDSATELQEIIEQLNRRGAEVKTGEIYPTDTVPVLANNKSMVITPFAMKWGYTLPDGKQLRAFAPVKLNKIFRIIYLHNFCPCDMLTM